MAEPIDPNEKVEVFSHDLFFLLWHFNPSAPGSAKADRDRIAHAAFGNCESTFTHESGVRFNCSLHKHHRNNRHTYIDRSSDDHYISVTWE